MKVNRFGREFEVNKLDEGFDEESAIDELIMYIDNDGDLYRRMIVPIRKSMMSKVGSGKYDKKLAAKSFMMLANEGAKKYSKEFGGKLNVSFPAQLRKKAAEMMADNFHDSMKSGEYDEYLPKKYQKKSTKSESGIGATISMLRNILDSFTSQ